MFAFVIIEFYGDYWHTNPKKYSNDFILYAKVTAQEKRIQDGIRIKVLEALGYNILIIWEGTYKTDSESILKQCINFF